MLKLQDNLIQKPLGTKAYQVFSNRIKAKIFFEKIETEADKALKESQIQMLQASIERREKLLSNENYVQKAPAHIVEMDQQKLREYSRQQTLKCAKDFYSRTLEQIGQGQVKKTR